MPGASQTTASPTPAEKPAKPPAPRRRRHPSDFGGEQFDFAERRLLFGGKILGGNRDRETRGRIGFMLLADPQRCPCGYLNDPTRDCACAGSQIQKSLGRLSGPMTDRIDMHVEVTPVPYDELNRRKSGPKSEVIRDQVIDARYRQQDRFTDVRGIHCNAQMGSRHVREWCRLDSSSEALMKAAVHRLGLSARAFHRILKVARTIADLAGEEEVSTTAVAEAIQYRSLDREWWKR